MSKLPENRKERESELLNKDNWSRGSLAKLKPVARPRNIKFPKKLVGILLITVFVLGGFYILVKDYYPDLFKRGHETKVTAQAFEYPFEVNEVKISGEMQRSKFLENFQKASGERDPKARYKLLEENFLALRGFYVSSQSSQYRVYLEKFKVYMQKYFPKEVSQNSSIYNVPCLDLLCGTPKLPAEITALKLEIDANGSIGTNTKTGLDQTFNAAGFAKDKTEQAVYYINALSALYTEYMRTKDEKTRTSYQKLYDFVKADYGEFTIPDQITLHK